MQQAIQQTGSALITVVERIILPSDPNALLDRLDLLLASHKACNTGVRNEIVANCDEPRRKGILDNSKYKYLMDLI